MPGSRLRSSGTDQAISSPASIQHLLLKRVDDFAVTAPDLIVEAAHPEISVAHGATFLEACDYMPLSVTALADDDLRARLVTTAERARHHLILPQGALVGTDALLAWRHMWRDVTITFRKHPHNIDLAAVKRRAQDITSETVIFDGPVREIAPLFPRNVNTMVTCALATVGLDKCRGRMIADPALDHAVAEVEAWGKDGSYLTTVKRQPMVGVSGTEMFAINPALGAQGDRHRADDGFLVRDVPGGTDCASTSQVSLPAKAGNLVSAGV